MVHCKFTVIVAEMENAKTIVCDKKKKIWKKACKYKFISLLFFFFHFHPELEKTEICSHMSEQLTYAS